jgi:hypothetical protein
MTNKTSIITLNGSAASSVWRLVFQFFIFHPIYKWSSWSWNAVLLPFVTGCSFTYWSLNIPWNLWINNYLFIEIHAVNVIIFGNKMPKYKYFQIAVISFTNTQLEIKYEPSGYFRNYSNIIKFGILLPNIITVWSFIYSMIWGERWLFILLILLELLTTTV